MSIRCWPSEISCAVAAGRKIGPRSRNVYVNKPPNKNRSCINPAGNQLRPVYPKPQYQPYPLSSGNQLDRKTPRTIPGENSNSAALSISVTIPRKNDTHPEKIGRLYFGC